MAQKRQREGEGGYAMVVVALILAAFMTLVGFLIEGNEVGEQINRRQAAMTQLHMLASALVQYAVYHNGRYPARPPTASNITIAAVRSVRRYPIVITASQPAPQH
jgi:hypothetical protein